MEDKDYEIKEVEENISSNDIKPTDISDESTGKNLNCMSNAHEEQNRIREGNKLFAILVKKDQEWSLESYTCWKCSVRDIVEEYHNEPVAVVETSLRVGDEFEDLYFKDAQVRDLMTKHT
jgi:hypothetical protein